MSAPPEPSAPSTTPTNDHHVEVAPYRTNPNHAPNTTCDAKCTRITLAVVIPILTIAILITAYLVYFQVRRSKKEKQAQQVEDHVREKLGEIGQSKQDLRNVDWEEATLEGSVKNNGVNRERGHSDASAGASVSDVSSMSDDFRSFTTLRVDESEIGVARTTTTMTETAREIRV